jgi:hypothetical protein
MFSGSDGGGVGTHGSGGGVGRLHGSAGKPRGPARLSLVLLLAVIAFEEDGDKMIGLIGRDGMTYEL